MQQCQNRQLIYPIACQSHCSQSCGRVCLFLEQNQVSDDVTQDLTLPAWEMCQIHLHWRLTGNMHSDTSIYIIFCLDKWVKKVSRRGVSLSTIVFVQHSVQLLVQVTVQLVVFRARFVCWKNEWKNENSIMGDILSYPEKKGTIQDVIHKCAILRMTILDVRECDYCYCVHRYLNNIREKFRFKWMKICIYVVKMKAILMGNSLFLKDDLILFNNV